MVAIKSNEVEAVLRRADTRTSLFLVYGLYIALADGIGKALITDLAPPDRRATALGTYGMVTGLAALIASVVAGLLWDHVNTAAPFVFGTVAALLGGLLLLALPARTHSVAGV